ncbi:hypothetical protein AH02_58 [Pseudomonas phage AH02]|nr:hypothetical protein AH02_58 [Pseudomonas phage AH02]
MSDYSELKRLAEAAIAEKENASGNLGGEDVRSRQEFKLAANPAAVLALIAENEQAEEDNVIWKGGISALGGALKKLTFCARTVTDGPDHALMSACDEAENALSLIGVSRAIDYIEGLKAENKDLQEKYEAARDRKNSITALRAEVEALRKDAERYRWLRDYHIGDDPDSINLDKGLRSGLSSAIDAAMGKESDE